MVEEMENQIRNSLNTIYFDKTKSILNSLRSTIDGEEKSKRDALQRDLVNTIQKGNNKFE
jgi:capping protein beta